MTPEEIKNCRILDTLITQNQNFAIYRIPGETSRFVMQTSGSARLLYNIGELDGQSGFVIAPFQVSKQSPIVLIQPNLFEIPFQMEGYTASVKKIADPNEKKDTWLRNGKSEYMEVFDHFIKPLREKKFDKLVLSRCLRLKKKADFSPAQAFYKASKRYTHSYIYLVHTPETGTWLGSTPEIILSGEQGKWQTVALAGTQPLNQGKLPTYWDNKNREEQELVAAYVRAQLRLLDIVPQEEGPCAVHAGELSHLKSSFRFSLSDNKKLGDLLRRLHPTPAVCGLPKEEAFQFIREHEGYDRRYYSGFIGRLNPEGRSDLYVNLRCMNILSDKLTLYAGGGLLASSEPESEWQETEAKMQTMNRLLS